MTRAAALAATLAFGAALALPASADSTIRVGVTAGPHAEIFDEVAKLAAKRGIDVKVIEFTDYAVPNQALDAGDLDANSFQNEPFLEQQIKDRGYHLVSIGKTILLPMGIYSKRYKSLADVKDGATVSIPNDPTNGARALLLLQAKGLIKLKPDAGVLASPADVADNPKHLQIQELNAAQTPRSLDDLDLAVINGNYALTAGLTPKKDALAAEAVDEDDALKSRYTNLIAVREKDKDDPRLQALVAIYHGPEIKHFIEERFKGVILTAF
jgi:D-methionine transport system substrate-binding protein